MREWPFDRVLVSFDNGQYERISRNGIEGTREAGEFRLHTLKMVGHGHMLRREEKKRNQGKPFRASSHARRCKDHNEEDWQHADIEIGALAPHPGNRPEQCKKERGDGQPPAIPAKLRIATPCREKPCTQRGERNAIERGPVTVHDHSEWSELLAKSAKDDLPQTQADARGVQVKRHTRQCQRAAPDPVAKRPPIEREMCRDDQSRNAESQQVREVQHGETREGRNPSRDALLRKPAQPESECEESNREAQIKIQEPFEKKHIVGNQERPQGRCGIAWIHLTKQKPGRGRQRESAQAQKYAARRLYGKQPAEDGQ